ncbi:MAG: DNA primase [Candidatus Magasanikbacteria bacterium CG11_big_fil_rev_8_21_14_0_20_39_34]|uniref:DNA primase n=1 Tax=Candidatus Magasanikbacteria bacterium CG11_big_fil_rev_8_21_14_0_20_39_34 TaxID=1974653 RepID=A0A2H0N5A7_9BACT|nr:MAG: DNA primase [Candidatus Magasanikbacteria bacterium CG11_big_fil_rev_8_21_14_0_20_39_34]
MSDTQQIKEKIDIVELISEYISLKPSGINHKGLCPFHNEKSPSFMVNRERQSWHCFGCNKGGDVFTFVEEIEGLDFVESLRLLAKKAGIELTTLQKDVHKSQKNRIKDINRLAATFYHNFLIKMAPAQEARDYLLNRGMTTDTLEKWQVGYVVDQWDLLTKYMLKKGHSIDDLVASGLTIKRDNANPQTFKGFYDRFRGRIIFPIQNVHGDVVGFTARVLKESKDSGGKYINTPQTLVFDKSQVVFGLYHAKNAIRAEKLAIFVEGQTDVISCHQAGSSNVVATSGTALTQGHIKLIKRYSNNIAFCFDADSAGIDAAKRAIGIALEEGLNVKIIRIAREMGKDPDEVIKKDRALWTSLVENAQDVMSWYFQIAFQRSDLSNPKIKQEIANELLPEIKKIPYAVEREHWIQELSNRVGVEISVLKDEMARFDLKKETFQPVSEKKKAPQVPLKPQKRSDLLIERFLSITLKYLKTFDSQQISAKMDEALSTSSFGPLYLAIKKGYNDGQLSIDILRESCDQKTSENPVDILLLRADLDFSDYNEGIAQEESKKLLFQIEREWEKERRKLLESQIQSAESAKDKTRLDELMRALISLD